MRGSVGGSERSVGFVSQSPLHRLERVHLLLTQLRPVKKVAELDVCIHSQHRLQSDVRRRQTGEAAELREDLLLTERVEKTSDEDDNTAEE